MMAKWLCAAALALVAGAAQAACSGSGLTWTCTAGSTIANINSAISSGSDGMTITLANGSYTWSSPISWSSTKATTVICESKWGCTVTASSTIYDVPLASSSKLWRLSGFDITGNNAVIWVCSGGSGCNYTVSGIRIDNNRFNATDGQIIMFGEGSQAAKIYGVFDNNTVIRNDGANNAIHFFGATDTGSPTLGMLGSANNFFFENNTFTQTTNSNSSTGCIDGWGQSNGIVWRFNTMTNCRVLMHGVTHGWGPSNFEVYKNSFTFNSQAGFTDAYRTVHHQGSGTYMVWDNVITPYVTISSDAIVVLHYRSFQAGSGSAKCDGTVGVDGNRSGQQGYPCYHQPGRDSDGKLRPVFAWRNRTNGGTKIDLALNDGGGGAGDLTSVHMQANRDFYNAVSANAQSSASSPFNGTTGMGFGTLANRPTTCTTESASADAGNGGVGYWATDVGNWNGFVGAEQGRLYICSATNTWTTYYEPYKYPHPLRVMGGPAPPGNLRQGWLRDVLGQYGVAKAGE